MQKGKKKNEICLFCTKREAKSLCSCQAPPALLCRVCVAHHCAASSTGFHEISPIEALDHIEVPGYKEKLQQREKVRDEAISSVKDNLKAIDGWKRDICKVADFLIAQAVALRTRVDKEMSDLLHTVAADIEAGEVEFRDTFYEPDPQLRSPIAKAMRHYEAGTIPLISCQTRFGDIRKAFEGFLFSVHVRLQAELKGYEPCGLVKSFADVASNKKVNVYLPPTADFYTPQTRPALANPQDYSSDSTVTIKRGPIADETGDIYTGEWNRENQRHGLGKYQWQDGSVYIGQWRRGEFHGKGRQIFESGNVYEGEYQLHMKQGFGRYMWANGARYVGEFADNFKQGVGFYDYGPDSALCYFGEFVSGKIEGRGVQFGPEGPVYAGCFKNWERHGKGVLLQNAQCFFGEFFEGKHLPH